MTIPATAPAFLEEAERFRKRLADLKRSVTLADYGWYPYDSLTVLSLLRDLIQADYAEIAKLVAAEPVADLGCADGDLAMLFHHFGAEVDAVDHLESNYNQMRGVETLKRELHAGDVHIYDRDLDGRFELPRNRYGLVLFLGTLYHLKNPFYVLEQLASAGAFCVLSTRIAQVTFKTGVRIESEPVAYLLDPRESNNDPTNFWIFSEAGLLRLLDRAGWIVRNKIRLGCAENSNPVDLSADERIFLLLKSRQRYPDLHVRPLEGWHAIEEDGRRWTAKRFSIEVALPRDRETRQFALRFVVPEIVIAASPEIQVSCTAGGEPAGSITCREAETIEFRGNFPDSVLGRPAITLSFRVESAFQPAGDRRELGILIPLLDAAQTSTSRLPFRIS